MRIGPKDSQRNEDPEGPINGSNMRIRSWMDGGGVHDGERSLRGTWNGSWSDSALGSSHGTSRDSSCGGSSCSSSVASSEASSSESTVIMRSRKATLLLDNDRCVVKANTPLLELVRRSEFDLVGTPLRALIERDESGGLWLKRCCSLEAAAAPADAPVELVQVELSPLRVINNLVACGLRMSRELLMSPAVDELTRGCIPTVARTEDDHAGASSAGLASSGADGASCDGDGVAGGDGVTMQDDFEEIHELRMCSNGTLQRLYSSPSCTCLLELGLETSTSLRPKDASSKSESVLMTTLLAWAKHALILPHDFELPTSGEDSTAVPMNATLSAHPTRVERVTLKLRRSTVHQE